MPGSRILPAAFALVLLSTLWFLSSRGARSPERDAVEPAEPSDEAAPAELLAEPVTSAPDALRREAELSPQAADDAAALPEEPARTVELLVTDPARNPLAGARIRVALGYEEEPWPTSLRAPMAGPGSSAPRSGAASSGSSARVTSTSRTTSSSASS